jgi:predicted MFS family arabinose efflux permease
MADITSNENRTQAMALIGMMIGLAFSLALGVGPIVNHLAGLNGIFWLTAFLAGAGLLLLWLVVPTPNRIQLHQDVEAVPNQLLSVLKKGELLRLDWGIGALHAVLTALFMVLPSILRHDLNLADSHMAYYYLPIAILAFIAMVPFIVLAEQKRKMKMVYVSMIITLLVANLVIGLFNTNIWLVTVALLVFLSAFSALEALLPSLVSKQCPPDRKGSAMGVYSSSQFLGIFIGGMIGGLALQYFGLAGVFIFSSFLLTIWLVLAIAMNPPSYLSTKIYDISFIPQDRLSHLQNEMLAVNGVSEVVVMADTGVAYLKVDTKIVEYDHINDVIQQLASNNRS